MKPEKQITEDNTYTLYNPEIQDCYHSIHGARQESEHVFIKNGLNHLDLYTINIFEAGFGTGLNAFLSALEAERKGITINYTATDIYYPEFNPEELNYVANPAEKEIWDTLLSIPLNTNSKIGTHFNIIKYEQDLTRYDFPKETFHLIYFDAFAPEKQPGMWTPEMFSRLYKSTVKGGILVTYSAKGTVKRALQEAGYEITKLAGPPGKKHNIRAKKH